MGVFQDNAIFHFQLLPEGPIWLHFVWYFSDDAWPSIHYSVLEQRKLIIFLGCNSFISQAVTSYIQLTCNLMNVLLG